MFGHSRFTGYVVSFLALLGPAAQAANLYRMDDRTPAAVHASGGLTSWNPSGTGTVLEHAKATLGKQDPWVSTTNSKTLAAKGATSPGEVYVYYINPTGLSPVDVAKAFAKAKQDNPHPGEKEFAVKGSIPWKNIVSWDTYERSKKTSSTTAVEWEKSQSSGASSPKHARDFKVSSSMEGAVV